MTEKLVFVCTWACRLDFGTVLGIEFTSPFPYIVLLRKMEHGPMQAFIRGMWFRFFESSSN